MKPQEALDILMRAAGIAQSKGAFNLAEARMIADAIDTFNPPKQEAITEKNQPVPEATPAPLPAETEIKSE